MKHFGKEFQRVVQETGLPVTVITERLGISRRNIYKIFEKESIDLALAVRLSEGMQHDFLQHYLLPENIKLLSDAQRKIRQSL